MNGKEIVSRFLEAEAKCKLGKSSPRTLAASTWSVTAYARKSFLESDGNRESTKSPI